MKMIVSLVFIVFMSAQLASCAGQPLKAPCNAQGAFCGKKIKINQW